MSRIYVPTSGAADWSRLLARPGRHWKAGFSAMSVAQSWESASGALPPEISALLNSSPDTALHGLGLLLAIPEYQVELPGGSRPTQTDVFALVRSTAGLAAIAVEGKVDETFGPTVSAKRLEGAAERLASLHRLLEIDETATAEIRYQLLHRTAAAIILAQRFHARSAVMVVQSFSPHANWFDDFAAFAGLFGQEAVQGRLVPAGVRDGVPLHLGWATGDQRFRKDLSVVPPAL